MRSTIQSLLLLTGLALLASACNKVGDLPYHDNGIKPVLTVSTHQIAAQPADSNNIGLTLSWTDPKYATDSAHVKYTIEIDSAGKGFTRPATRVVMGNQHSTSFTNKEINNILLGFGYPINVAVDMDVRVISSYANNNERLISNVERINMKAYKIPPKVALPASGKLFIVGDATTFGWSNDPTPAFPPEREFSRLDETTWAGIFYLDGSGAYKLLQTQGDWGSQYHMVTGGTATSGSFVKEDADPGFPSPATAGWYRLAFDFQTGNYTVTPYSSTLPAELFIVGDATPGGWANPVPVPSQKLTRLNSSEFEITMQLNGNGEYLILPNNGDWTKKYALDDKNVPGIFAGGEFGYHFDGQPAPDDYGDNFKAPPTTGTYTIRLNFAGKTTQPNASGTFKVTP
jgi:hypothetical protein